MFYGSPTAEHNFPSVFGGTLRSSAGIFWIQTSRGHDGASELFCGKDNFFVGHGAGGIFFGVGRDETITSAYDSLQVLRLTGIIGQGAANFADRGIDSLFDVDEYIFAPQCAGDLLARYQLSSLFDQKHQQLQRQALEAHRYTTARKLKAAVIQLEIVETNVVLRHGTHSQFRSQARHTLLQFRILFRRDYRVKPY